MKTMPQFAAPSTDQQKTIQLQMLNHMRKEFESEPDLSNKIGELQKELAEGSVTPI
jgi:hypothetical protein